MKEVTRKIPTLKERLWIFVGVVIPFYLVLFLGYCGRSRTWYDVTEIDKSEITSLEIHVMESGFDQWTQPDSWFYQLSCVDGDEAITRDLVKILDEVKLRSVWFEWIYRDPVELSSISEGHAVSVVIYVKAEGEYTCITVGNSGNVQVTIDPQGQSESKQYRFTDSRMLDRFVSYAKEYGEVDDR